MHPSDVRTRRAHLRLCLVTLGDPNQRTGGYRYHRMMAAAAADHRAELRFEQVPPLPWPIPALPAARTVRAAAEGSDAILLDSIAAAYAAPWIARIRTPVVAVVHQPPGGVGHRMVRSSAQRRLDGLAYRSAAGIVAASETLVDELRAIGVPADRIVVVPPGSDVPMRERSAARPSSWPRGIGALRRELDAVEGDPRAAGRVRHVAGGGCHAVAGRAPSTPIAATPNASAAGSRRRTSPTASSCAAPCRSRRSAGSTDRPTCSRSARSSTRTERRGPRRSRRASPSSGGAPATCRDSPNRVARR